MKRKDDIPLTKEQKESAIARIKEYILENFDVEVGNLQSEIFLDYIIKHIGVYYYNKGITDSMVFMTDKIDDFYLLMKDEDVWCSRLWSKRLKTILEELAKYQMQNAF